MTEAENEILKEMGFDKLESGRYNHNLGIFDFSKFSLKDVIYDIYSRGLLNGRASVQAEIQNIIGIK